MSKRFPTSSAQRSWGTTPCNTYVSSKRPSPTGIPVWFDWDGHALRMFAGADSAKIKHLHENPHASVLVTNHIGEPEGWFALMGL